MTYFFLSSISYSAINREINSKCISFKEVFIQVEKSGEYWGYRGQMGDRMGEKKTNRLMKELAKAVVGGFSDRGTSFPFMRVTNKVTSRSRVRLTYSFINETELKLEVFYKR